MVGVLGLGLVAPASAARVSGSAADSQGNLNPDSVDQGLLLTEDCLEDYDDDVGFKVGDYVRLVSLREDGTAKMMHNKVGIVKCPGASSKAHGTVCLEGMGCFKKENLVKMTAADKALFRLSSISAELAGAVVEEIGPVVKERILLKAGTVQENVEEIVQSAKAKAEKAWSSPKAEGLFTRIQDRIWKPAKVPAAGKSQDLLESIVDDHGPAVQESILLLAETMMDWEEIVQSTKAKADKAQGLVTRVQDRIDELRALAEERNLADVPEQVQALVVDIQSQIRHMTRQTTREIDEEQ